ncbi:uncharacterized protein LOC105781540 [Gossypium raimondii]|uniref:uncharacterized protein LOC105781540 n=1 Tax=Gossypium raimondii TaxID=29730 RepID=UPI00227CB7C0|nr:uncharacterized protein LOC105781540 [Gossypium raimondii]
MANQTLKQLAAPNLAAQPPSITYPALDRPLKLNSGFLNFLPKFNGLPGEDSYRHINEFLITCSTMQPDGIEEEQIKLRAFPFSLQGLAKNWLYYMPPGSFTTWTGLHKAFLEKYFPASRIGSIRKEICGIKQLVGLTPQDRGMIDAASGGALVDKTPEQARNLIANMAQNTQQFGLRRSDLGKRMDEGQSSMMEAQLANLTAMEGEANAVFPNQRRYDPYSATYNEGWRDHPNLRYQNRAAPPGFEQQNSRQYNSSQQQPSHQNLMKQLQTRASSTDVNLGNLQAQVNNRLPSQPVANPRDNVSAITLRSGKELRSILKKGQNSNEEDETEQILSRNEGSELEHKQAPFPQRLRKEKSDDVNAKILETFHKVQVNIPLIDAIKQVPRYAKFLKELCTSKRKLIGNEKISLGENVSAVFQKKLPIKCKDPGMFSIPCKIGDLKLDRAMLDLGASINVMPRSIYDKVQLGALKDTRLIIQLADRSNAYPDGVLEDVLVQVNELVFPADFYVLDMRASDNSVDVPLLLGRPFLKTN